MPDDISSPRTTRQLEQLREILLGTELRRIKRRLEALESSPTPASGTSETASLADLRSQVTSAERRYDDEFQRLQQRIEALSQHHNADKNQLLLSLEAKLKRAFEDYRQSLEGHLRERDRELVEGLSRELASIRAMIEESRAHFPEVDPLRDERLLDAFEKLGAASQSIADILTPQSNDQSP